MDRGEYIKRFNNLISAVSDSDKEHARAQLRYLVERIINDRDPYYFRRLADDMMVSWYDTYKGRGPFLPREVAGISRTTPE